MMMQPHGTWSLFLFNKNSLNTIPPVLKYRTIYSGPGAVPEWPQVTGQRSLPRPLPPRVAHRHTHLKPDPFGNDQTSVTSLRSLAPWDPLLSFPNGTEPPLHKHRPFPTHFPPQPTPPAEACTLLLWSSQASVKLKRFMFMILLCFEILFSVFLPPRPAPTPSLPPSVMSHPQRTITDGTHDQGQRSNNQCN